MIKDNFIMTYTDKGVVVNFRIPRSKLWGEPLLSRIYLDLALLEANQRGINRSLAAMRSDRIQGTFTLPEGSLD